MTVIEHDKKQVEIWLLSKITEIDGSGHSLLLWS